MKDLGFAGSRFRGLGVSGFGVSDPSEEGFL